MVHVTVEYLAVSMAYYLAATKVEKKEVFLEPLKEYFSVALKVE